VADAGGGPRAAGLLVSLLFSGRAGRGPTAASGSAATLSAARLDITHLSDDERQNRDE